jgi:hypothetical protein
MVHLSGNHAFLWGLEKENHVFYTFINYNLGAKVRISEENTKGKLVFLFIFEW